MHRRIKYDTLCTCVGRGNKITISAKLFDVMYESYIFNADLIEAILHISYKMNINVVRLVSPGIRNYRLRCYV